MLEPPLPVNVRDLAQDFSAHCAVALHASLFQRSFKKFVGPTHKPYAAPRSFGQAYAVPPKIITMRVNMLEDNINSIPNIFSRASFWAAIFKGSRPYFELMTHFVKVFYRCLIRKFFCQSQFISQFIE